VGDLDIEQRSKDLASGVKIPTLGQRHEFFGQGAQLLGLRLGCADLFVSKEISRLVPQQGCSMTRRPTELALS
jgi:hypothetical protein